MELGDMLLPRPFTPVEIIVLPSLVLEFGPSVALLLPCRGRESLVSGVLSTVILF